MRKNLLEKEMSKKERAIPIGLTIVSSVCVAYNLIFEYTINQNFLGLLIIMHSLYILYCYRENRGLFIAAFFMLFSNYSIVMGVYWDEAIRPDVLYSQITNELIYAKAITTLLMFETTLTAFSIYNVKRGVKTDNKIKEEKPVLLECIVALTCAAIVVVIFITQFDFGAGGDRASITPLFEYKIIFIVIGFVYSKNSRPLQAMWIVLIAVTSGASFIGGNRVDGLVAVIAYGTHYHSNIKVSRLAAILFGGMFAMIGIGYMRTGFTFDRGVWVEIWNNIKEGKFTFDTAVWAYFPALSSVALEQIDYLDKWQLLKDNVIYIFAGGDYAYQLLQNVTRRYYIHENGFVSPLYFYIWFKLFSGIIVGMLVNMYMKLSVDIKRYEGSKVKYGLYLYFVSMTPRWYLYGPFTILRGMMLFIIAIIIISIMLKLITGKKSG